MLQSSQKKILLLFWLVTLLDITGLAFSIKLLHVVAKPVLIPLLGILVWRTTGNSKLKQTLLAGLFFSWLGDIFLLFDAGQSLYFILGLACFLTTHVFYILHFMANRSQAPSLLKKAPVLTALVAGYGVTLVWLLFPYLAGLKVPVTVYASVICCMLLGSLHIFFKINRQAALCYLAGALAFVLSDSLLALNKFYQSFPLAGIWVMITYCLAQCLLVLGFIKNQTT